MKADDLYTEYQNLINKRAWSWHKTTGIPFEELQAESNLIFCEAAKSFDPDQSSFSTWLTLRLNHGLNKHTRYLTVRRKRETYYGLPGQSIEENSEFYSLSNSITPHDEPDEVGVQYIPCDEKYNPERTAIFRDTVENLSVEAKQVVKVLFNAPAELAEVLQANSQRAMKGALQRYLRSIRRTKPVHWTWPMIWKVMKELKTTFS